mmetsp:Transcript_100810/g.291492  ORF Transcript_100810/g.291492 Transcript_100810/m.291492 type:complete len:331 (-) Transcript_100810:215-1207(-)
MMLAGPTCAHANAPEQNERLSDGILPGARHLHIDDYRAMCGGMRLARNADSLTLQARQALPLHRKDVVNTGAACGRAASAEGPWRRSLIAPSPLRLPEICPSGCGRQGAVRRALRKRRRVHIPTDEYTDLLVALLIHDELLNPIPELARLLPLLSEPVGKLSGDDPQQGARRRRRLFRHVGARRRPATTVSVLAHRGLFLHAQCSALRLELFVLLQCRRKWLAIDIDEYRASPPWLLFAIHEDMLLAQRFCRQRESEGSGVQDFELRQDRIAETRVALPVSGQHLVELILAAFPAVAPLVSAQRAREADIRQPGCLCQKLRLIVGMLGGI